MSHDIFTLDGQEQSFAAGTAAWHGKGVTVAEGAKSLADVREQGILDGDYTVESIQDDRLRGLEDRRVLCWQDAAGEEKPLVVSDFVTERYKLVTLDEVFQTVDPLLQSGDLEIVSAGMIAGGSKVFATLRVAEGTIQLADSPIESMISLLLDYRKSANTTIPSNVRTVCSNTWSVNERIYSSSDDLKSIFPRLTHKGNVRGKLDDQKKALAAYVAGGVEAGKVYRQMAETEITQDEFRAFVDTLLPMPEPLGANPSDKDVKRHDRAVTRAKNLRTILVRGLKDETSEICGNTVWRLFNGATYATDHLNLAGCRTNKGRDPWEAQYDCKMLGGGASLKDQAIQLCLDLIA